MVLPSVRYEAGELGEHTCFPNQLCSSYSSKLCEEASHRKVSTEREKSMRRRIHSVKEDKRDEVVGKTDKFEISRK